MKSKKSFLSILTIAAFLFIVIGWNSASANFTNSQTQSGILYVKPGANGTCSSWADPCELQTALSNANAGDQIWVAAGTYKPTTDTDRTATFQLKSGVAIYGGFAGTETSFTERDWETNITTLSGDIGNENDNSDNSYHVVDVSLVNSVLMDGFTISDGNGERGAGLFVSFSDLSLSNITFSENSATYFGGGLFNDNSSPILTNVIFVVNSASGWDGSSGGGMFNYQSHPALNNVTFTDNTAEIGGGMGNFESNPTLTDVTFSYNAVASIWGSSGGGMSNDYSSPTLTNVAFIGNSADGGGGMHNYFSNPTLTNVTFSDNAANSDGAGMYEMYSNSTLAEVTFSGNLASEYGGGMYNYDSSPTLTNVSFSENIASAGGGIYNDFNSNPTLTDTSFTSNSAEYGGGGMSNWNNSCPSLTNVSFSSNTSTVSGGGMSNVLSNPTLNGVTFTNNKAIGQYANGGGMSNSYSDPTLTNVTFNNNLAESGGGMLNYSSSPTLTNVTFSGNSVSADAAGLYNYESSSPTLTNVTFYSNTSFGWYSNCGGIGSSSDSIPVITNTILWDNTGDQICGQAIITYSDIQGDDVYPGMGNINEDPLLGGLADNGGFTQTHAIAAGSPAIDAGDPEVCPDFDQRGVTRPIDGDGDGIAVCDIGAYEYGSTEPSYLIFLPLIVK